MTIEFCYLIFITADCYAINYFINSKYLRRGKYFIFISLILFVISLSGYLRALVAEQMNVHFFHQSPKPDFITLFLNSVINISFWTLLILLGKFAIEKVRSRQKLEISEKERIKNELNFLKAQINPHSLFNSLNAIYGHIDKNNKTARGILLQFSELLRYQLYDCIAEKVALGKEIDYIKNYVAFQQLRKDECLRVHLDAACAGADLQIAPLLIVVLIENAFKFVSNSSEFENKIIIRLNTEGNTLRCAVFNTLESCSGSPRTSVGGIGITNLKRRLALLYPDKHRLTVKNENGFYETELSIDLL